MRIIIKPNLKVLRFKTVLKTSTSLIGYQKVAWKWLLIVMFRKKGLYRFIKALILLENN